MDFNNLEELKELGFHGFKPIYELWQDNSSIPDMRGVYLVLNLNEDEPKFIFPGVGGHFKDRDPNVSESKLTSNWVEDSKVIYIGKAGSLTSQATLRSRLRQYLRFGKGKKVGHWGGRYIWQLECHADLVMAWATTPEHDPREIEKSLLALYEKQFGGRPFANLTG